MQKLIQILNFQSILTSNVPPIVVQVPSQDMIADIILVFQIVEGIEGSSSDVANDFDGRRWIARVLGTRDQFPHAQLHEDDFVSRWTLDLRAAVSPRSVRSSGRWTVRNTRELWTFFIHGIGILVGPGLGFLPAPCLRAAFGR